MQVVWNQQDLAGVRAQDVTLTATQVVVCIPWIRKSK